MNVQNTHKVAIFAPRLDCSFKPGPASEIYQGDFGTPNASLRTYWVRFLHALKDAHESFGDTVDYIVKPLWQMSPEDVAGKDYDRVYIPHKHKFQFDCGPASRYYMQMVFPNVFSIDEEGWCAGAASYPIRPIKTTISKFYDESVSRIGNNDSKFPQPDRDPSFTEEDYILFLCQIPHDETIRYHGNVTVAGALRETLKLGQELGKKVIVKGHPVNLQSMTELRQITEATHGGFWVDVFNLHQLIEQSAFVATVNSGSGMESLLHNKRVLAFGKADYDGCYNVYSTPQEIKDVLSSNIPYNPYHNVQFFEAWYQNHYDVNFLSSFEKLLYK